MTLTNEQIRERLTMERFPLASKYDPQWIFDNEMGPNALWVTECLCEAMDLRRGMRVLDMGCGKALSSVFLARELDVQVWAVDLWIKATDNWQRIQQAGLEDRVFPIHADARSLPFAEGFFDAIVSLDSYHYFGTDDLYLQYFVKFLRPGGQVGIFVPGYLDDFGPSVPDHLKGDFHEDWHSFHTADWWRWHWEKTRLVDVEVAEAVPQGWDIWMKWEETRDAAGGVPPGLGTDAAVLRADGGRHLGFVRMVARKPT